MNIVAISGSLRADSCNTKLVRVLQSCAPNGMTVTPLEIGNLPLYNGDLEAEFPTAAQTLKDAILAADGVVFVTPEYNRSIPGVLKNAIDWASRPYGQSAWAHKPVLTAGVSIGKIGTAVAQSHLRSVLAYLDMKVVGQPELYLTSSDAFDDQGALTAHTRDLVTKALEALAAQVSR